MKCPHCGKRFQPPLTRRGLVNVNVYKDALIFGLSAILLWHFSNIARFGSHIIKEPSSLTLYAEIGLLISVFLFGLVYLILDLRKLR